MDSSGAHSIPKESTKVVAENYLKFREAEAKGEFVPNRHKDALYMALGEKRDHHGRVKGFGGVNIGYRKAFGKPPPRIPMLGSSVPTPEEYRREITLSVREELNAEFDIKLSHSLAKALGEKGIPSLGFSTPVPPQRDPMEVDSTDLEILPPTMMKNPKCRLYLPDDKSGKVIQVAQGYVKTNLASNNSHNRERLKDHTIVCLEVVMRGFGEVKLPVEVPDFDGDELQHARGSFVQWPSRWVRYHDEAISYIEKFKELEVEGRGSNEPTSTSSRAPDGTPISHLSLDQNLPMNFSTLRGMLTNMENKLIAVALDVRLFHYEGKTADAGLSKDDVEHLFNNEILGIPVIHTFMRTLQEDLLILELVPKVGWLCPQTTSQTWVQEYPSDSGKFIERAIRESVEKRGAQYILAPIIQDGHCTLLVICPLKGLFTTLIQLDLLKCGD